MTLSVVCPIYNEEKFIGPFIESIIQQDYPQDDLEILLVDGMSNDKTRSIITDYIKRYPYLKLVDNPQQTVPYAMNNGIKSSKGKIILRLDAHSEYPNNYFSALVRGLQELEGAENVGGNINTLPCNETTKAYAIAECLSSKFGVGQSYARIGVKQLMSVDSVPFGCFWRSLFDRIGYFDTDLVRNQDDEFNARIIKNGGKIYILPDIELKYYPRDKIRKVNKMIYQYGLYKPLVSKKLGKPSTFRQFVPPLFVIGLILGIIFSCIFPNLFPFYLGVVIIHLLVGTIEGISSAKKTGKIGCVYLMPFIFFNMHMYYGLGYLRGLYNLVFHRSFVVKSNR